MTMRKRMAKGLASLFYSRLTILIGQLVQVPVLTTVWGVKVWGSWLVLTSVASFLSYSAIGLTPVIRSEAAMAFGREDYEEMRRLVSTGLAFVATVAVLGFALFAAVTTFGDPSRLFKDPVLPSDSVRFILLCLAGQIAINAVGGVLSASLSGRGSYGLAQSIDASRMLAEFAGLTTLVLAFHAGPRVAAMLYPSLAAVALVAGAATHLPRLFRPSPRVISLAIFGRLWRPMVGGLLLQFSYSTLFIQAPRLILSRLLGPTAVAAYALATYVVRPAKTITETIAFMLPVEFSFSYGRGDLPLARRLLSNSIMLGGLTALVASGFLIGLGPIAIRLLSLGAVPVDRATIAFFCIGLFAVAVSIVASEFLISINRIFYAALMLSGLGIPYLGLGYWLAGRFGVRGMAASTAVLECGFAAFTRIVTARHLEVSPLQIILGAVRSPIPLFRQELAIVLRKLRPNGNSTQTD
jgi:O-antigen/teichoic acid export membrane protein